MVEQAKRKKETEEAVRNNREPITEVRSKLRGELRSLSLPRFDEEFSLAKMATKVCLFVLKQCLTFNKPRTILAIVRWSGVNWPFSPNVGECVKLSRLRYIFALINLPLKTVSFKIASEIRKLVWNLFRLKGGEHDFLLQQWRSMKTVFSSFLPLFQVN